MCKATFVLVLAFILCGGFISVEVAYAHCDTLDGPVVAEAKSALEMGDVTPLLKWVGDGYEREVREAFSKALVVRGKGPEARDLADTYFFETLVRLHREGEGAPYTGLRPAGQIEAPVAAADNAIATGNVDQLARAIGKAAEDGVKQRFKHLMETREHKDESVTAGRDYVQAYVVFVHYVENLHNTISNAATHDHAAAVD